MVACAVRAETEGWGRKGEEEPTLVAFGKPLDHGAIVEAPDIVGPVSKEHVAGLGCHFHLHLQRVVRLRRVAGEANAVAVRTEACSVFAVDAGVSVDYFTGIS